MGGVDGVHVDTGVRLATRLEKRETGKGQGPRDVCRGAWGVDMWAWR